MTAQAVEHTRSFEDMAAEYLAALERAYSDAMARIAALAGDPAVVAVVEHVAQPLNGSVTVEIAVQAA